MARLPVIWRDVGTASSSCAHSALARPSFHKMAGRSTWPCASSTTAPCMWPERPMPRTCAHATGACARNCATEVSTAAHQSAGCCSLQVGWGRSWGTAASAVATTVCASSSSRSLTPEVPKSIPRYMGDGQMSVIHSESHGPAFAFGGLRAGVTQQGPPPASQGADPAGNQEVFPNLPAPCLRYSLGVMPLMSRKRRLKLAMLLKPTSYAMCVM